MFRCEAGHVFRPRGPADAAGCCPVCVIDALPGFRPAAGRGRDPGPARAPVDLLCVVCGAPVRATYADIEARGGATCGNPRCPTRRP